MRGDFPLGRALVAEGLETIAGLGFSLRAAMSSQEAFYVEMLAGDLDAAERIARDALRHSSGWASGAISRRRPRCSRTRSRSKASSTRPSASAARARRRRPPTTPSRRCSGAAPGRRSARAAASSTEAEALAREAVALAERTDLLNTHGDTLADLGEVIALAGRPDEAVAVYERGGRDLRAEGQPRLARTGPPWPRRSSPMTYDVLVARRRRGRLRAGGPAEREPGPQRLPRRGRARTTGTSPKAAGRRTSSTRAGSRSSRTSGSSADPTTARRPGRGSSAAARPTTRACCSRARPPTTTGAATGRTRLRAVPAPRLRDAAGPRARRRRADALAPRIPRRGRRRLDRPPGQHRRRRALARRLRLRRPRSRARRT